jgi:hypothetical protein
VVGVHLAAERVVARALARWALEQAPVHWVARVVDHSEAASGKSGVALDRPVDLSVQ